ncbi:MAG TPA: hypothetical protein VF638_01035 [Sphingomonas sp.]|jgi:hypothetical protein
MSDSEARARDASQLLDNPVFNEAIDTLKERAIASWLACKDPVERERLWMWTNQAIALRGYFQSIVDNARLDASRVAKSPLP